MASSRSTPSRRRPSATSRTSLPAERAFVVQLRADADLARGIVRGRVEHVLSGTVVQFENLDQLMDCMREVVARRSATSSVSKGSSPA